MSRAFTYWATSPTPQGMPRWAVGQWGPRYLIQGDEQDIVTLVTLLNQKGSS